jgi:multidrug efflux pump subunit AcrA (membrane-fusion protein)
MGPGQVSTIGDYQATQDAAKNRKAKAKLEADAAKRAKALAAAAAKQAAAAKATLAEQKKQDALKKASSIFDIRQIEIIAALKGNISAQDRLRLELQFALATDNVDEAKKLTYQLAISQGMTVALAKELASLPAASNPFAAWKGYLDDIELQAKKIAADAAAAAAAGKGGSGGGAGGGGGAAGIPPVFIPKSGADAYGGINNITGINRLGVATGGNQTIKVDLNIDGKLIAQLLQDASANGNQVYVNRVTGGFYY